MPVRSRLKPMTRDELILRTRQLIAEGERLDADPSLVALQTWLQLSDDLLTTAWGTMDRYHLAWLMVGKPKGIVRGRSMTAGEETAYVREVATQKTAALRMSLDAVGRQGMPFRGETGGIGPGQGMGEMPGTPATDDGDAAPVITGDAATDDGDAPTVIAGGRAPAAAGVGDATPAFTPAPPGPHRVIPLDAEVAARLEAARRAASEHDTHGERRAPRPERLSR